MSDAWPNRRNSREIGMAEYRDDYITIIAGNFLQPLASAVAKLIEKERAGVPGKSIETETDWSITCVLLAMTMFECWTAWPRQHRADRVPRDDDLKPFYNKLRAELQALPDLDDAFLLRNAIAHNHRWRVELETGEPGKIIAIHHLSGGRGDLQAKIDAEGRTKSGLRIVPSMIDRSDVKLVLERVCDALRVLAENDLMAQSFVKDDAGWPGEKRSRVNIFQIAAAIA
jgi:hypothetical protein